MTHRRRGRGGRAAFTLIELLVVIAIIAILMSLTGAAVLRALALGPKTKTGVELSELQSKLNAAKAKWGAKFLPSKLVLHEDCNYNNNPSQDERNTATVLSNMFGRPAVTPGNFIDWNGDGTQQSVPWTLEGEQCLVFYLAGLPTVQGGNVGMTGFSTNRQNPAQAGGTRLGPDFEFQSNRLLPGAGGFPFYLDPWSTGNTGKPYVYFASSVPEGNGSYQTTDCASFGPVTPYKDPSGKWVNARSFQIISAGRDRVFGAGGTTWNPTSGTTDPNGKDDQANFSSGLLGGPAN